MDPIILPNEIPPNVTHLDLSHHPHEYIGVSYPLPVSLTYLELMNCRLKGVCNLEPLIHLEYLGLRKNKIGLEVDDALSENEKPTEQTNEIIQDNSNLNDSSNIISSNVQKLINPQYPIMYNGILWGKGIAHLLNLKELDLYDNEITIIPEEINLLGNLEKLDLSFNKIKSLKPLDGKRLNSLRELYLVSNKIKKMIDFGDFEKLEILELGSNRIRKIKGLSNGKVTESLKQLWIGKNKITEIVGLENLVNLKSLSLQSNRLTEIVNLDTLKNLEQLYLSENDITEMKSLNVLINLQVLDLSYNKKLDKIEGISALSKLEEFWFSSNSLVNFSELDKLSHHKNLIDIYLQGNPLSKDPQYRRKILLILPQLENIDGFPVSLMKEKLK